MAESEPSAPRSPPRIGVPETAEPHRLKRPARALLGWMPPDAAHSIQGAGPLDAGVQLAHVERARAAREAVAARSPGVDQTDIVREAPASLENHLAALRRQAQGDEFFQAGWEVRLVDLARLCAFQTHVHTDDRAHRIAGIDGDDLASIAAVSLPEAVPIDVPIQYDSTRNAWILAGPNLNLRIVSKFQGQFQGSVPGATGFGFVVGVLPSLMQVARVQGRYVLRDGYHRACAFLRSGITHVPAFVRDFAATDELSPATSVMLPHEVFLGERPPVVADYLDDAVAADVKLPSFQKMIVIQALELSPMT
jgi:hypothetical protein